MKRAKNISLILVLLISFSVTGCFKDQPLDEDVARYSSISDIINPPDQFQLVYSLNTYNYYLALIEFETDAVWEIERISSPGFITVWVERSVGEDNTQLEVINAQNATYFIGLAGGIRYNFWASRSMGDDNSSMLLLQFTKQNIDYENFTPKI